MKGENYMCCFFLIICLLYFAIPILSVYYLYKTNTSNYVIDLESMYDDYRDNFNSSERNSEILNDTIKYFKDYQHSYDTSVDCYGYNFISLIILIFFHIFICSFIFCSTESGEKLITMCCFCFCKKDTPKCIEKLCNLLILNHFLFNLY